MTDTGPVPASTIKLALETIQKAIDKGMVEAKPIAEALLLACDCANLTDTISIPSQEPSPCSKV